MTGPLNIDGIKQWLRNSSAWPAICGFRAARFERNYRARRDAYYRQLELKGLVYDEAKAIEQARQRLDDRGYTPRPKPVGQVRTFCVIGRHAWHHDLIESLEQFGPTTNCDYTPFGLDTASRVEAAACRKKHAAHLLSKLETEHAREPFDWLFVYGGGRNVHPETIRTIQQRFGLPTVNLCLDDKNAWTIGPVGDVDGGQKDIAGAYDLSWTSASVACDWYLAEGGRAVYLPEGTTPANYTRTTEQYDMPISFMGACYGARPVVIGHLERAGLPIQVFGRGWGARGRSAESPVDLFSRSQINFGIGGIAFSEALTNVKGRDFDVPCTGGGVYLTTYNPDLVRSFDVGREILCYQNRDEAVELARHYLARPEACRRIADAARARCLAEHTWVHRYAAIGRMLGFVQPEHAGAQDQP